MPRSAAPITISEFAGMNNSDPAHNIPISVATLCKNLYFENGKLYPRKATDYFKNPSVSSGAVSFISSIGLYVGRINEEAFIISVSRESTLGDDLAVFYRWPDDGNPLSVPAAMTLDESTAYLADDAYGGFQVNFARLGDTIYAGNGQFLAYYDVTNSIWKRVQLAFPDQAVTAVVGIAGLLRGTYRYYIAYKDEARGLIGAPSPASDYITADDDKIELTFTAVPAGYVGVIYRVGGTTVDAFAVAEVAAASTTYSDNISDDDLGLELDFNATPIPNLQIIEFHKNRLIGAISRLDSASLVETDLTTLFISYYGQPQRCPLVTDIENPLDGARIPISARADGKITGLKPLGDYVVIFTKTDAYLLSGDDPSTFRLSPAWPIGCSAHRTIRNVDGVLTWQSDSGDVYAWSGQGYPQIVSKSVRNSFRLWTSPQKEAAFAWDWRGKYYLQCGGEIFFLDYKASSDASKFPWGQITGAIHDGVAVLGSEDESEERLFGIVFQEARLSLLEAEEGETALEPTVSYEWKSKLLSPEDDLGRVIDAFESRIRGVRCLVEGFPDGVGTPSPGVAAQKVLIGLRQDTGGTDSETHEVEINSAYAGEIFVQYDSDAGDSAIGHTHQLRLTGTAFSNDTDDPENRYHPIIHSVQVLIRPIR